MSSSVDNWELGVVAFYDSFENYDRFAKFGVQYDGIAAGASWDTAITLDSSICSDYMLSPFYLHGWLPTTSGGTPNPADALFGSELILGPSTDETYDGTIEKVSIRTISGYTISAFTKYASNTHMTVPTATYAVGDQILIRTVPLGWSARSVAFGSNKTFGVCPIKRYNERDSLLWLTANAAIQGLDDYSYESMRGVRLYCNNSTAGNSSQDLQRVGDVNSFIPGVRRWRFSCSYRLGQCFDRFPIVNQRAYIQAGIADATGDYITRGDADTVLGAAELGSFDTDGLLVGQVLGATTLTSGWTEREALVSAYPNTDTDNEWSFSSAEDTSKQAYNRGNRWIVRLMLTQGQNTAFDVDDVVIEHAHGTSQEANGYYMIDDFPDPETIQVQPVEIWKRNRLANGSLKQITTDVYERPKFILSAEFRDVDVAIYQDMRTLEAWVKRGYMIALRPKIEGIPSVMVGVIRITKNASRHWSLNRATFTLEFEEA